MSKDWWSDTARTTRNVFRKLTLVRETSLCNSPLKIKTKLFYLSNWTERRHSRTLFRRCREGAGEGGGGLRVTHKRGAVHGDTPRSQFGTRRSEGDAENTGVELRNVSAESSGVVERPWRHFGETVEGKGRGGSRGRRKWSDRKRTS